MAIKVRNNIFLIFILVSIVSTLILSFDTILQNKTINKQENLKKIDISKNKLVPKKNIELKSLSKNTKIKSNNQIIK